MNSADYDFNDAALKWADEVMGQTRYRVAKQGAVASGRSMYLTATGWSMHFEGDAGTTVCGDAITMPATRQQVGAYAFCLSCYGIKYGRRR